MADMKLPTLVFDYDGTIHETMRIYEPAFRKSFRWLVDEGLVEYEDISSERISSWLGMNSVDMWNAFHPELPEEIRWRASGIVGEEMISLIEGGTARWYEGAETILDRFRSSGFPMVILSNCKSSYRDAHWSCFDMGRWFGRWYDCESFNWAPKTEIIRQIAADHPGDLIVIGDRASDMEAARAAGAPFIGCLYGFGTGGELDGSDTLVNSVREIPDACLKYV